jgi:hypothetical protein
MGIIRGTYVVLALRNSYEDGCKLVNPTILMPTIRPRTGEETKIPTEATGIFARTKKVRERFFFKSSTKIKNIYM